MIRADILLILIRAIELNKKQLTNPNLTISYPVLYKAVSLYDWSLFNIFIQYKRKVELYQSQQYVPLSSFVFSIELYFSKDIRKK